MTALTVLHLSDLHWSPKTQQDIQIVTDALFDDLRRLKEKKGLQPDLVVFSGDLAIGGDETDWFQGAYDHFILPLAKQVGLSLDRVFVAPGNHDIAREAVRRIPSVEAGYRNSLTQTGAINAFIDETRQPGSEKDLALRRMDNFYDAHDSYHSSGISSSPFLRTYAFDVRGRRVGVACLNSAWRASGEPDDADYRRLLIGERSIDQALSDLADCDFRIAVHHHPLDWLVPADMQTTDFLTRRSFHLSCSGHVHASRPFMSRDASGVCVASQTGSIYDKREWFNGYQFIEIDIPSQTYTFTVREYIDSRRAFDVATTVCDGGSVFLSSAGNSDVKRTDQIELFLRHSREILREAVAKQLNIAGGTTSDSIHRLASFVTPPIMRRTRASLEQEDSTDQRSKVYKVDELLTNYNNFLLLGERQSGRTTLGYFIAYKIAFDTHCDPAIPVYVDLRDYKYNRYALRRAVLDLYGPPPSGFNIDQAIDAGLFVFIVDNLSPDKCQLERLAKHSKEFSHNRWIVLSTPDADGVSPDRLFNEHLSEFVKFHIGELTRGGIRAISKTWCKGDASEAKATYELVINQLVRDGLPRTPYMVSLLLWAIQQKRELTKVNEAFLLSAMMDHLLGKADFRLAKLGALNPVGKEITLQNLARYLREQGGTASENEVTTFLIEFFSKKKLSYIGGDVLEKLISCGILRRDGDHVSFKHPCFQEYFFASLLRNDRKLFDWYLEDFRFLEVRREFELVAGLRQQNDDIIDAIMSSLEKRVPTRFANCCANDFDSIAQSELKIGTTMAALGEIRRTRLTDEQVDEMMDEADRRAMARGERPVSESLQRADGNVVHAATEREAEGIAHDRQSDTAPIRPSTHMAAIDTLAKVVRNSDFSDYERKGPATQLIMESWTRIFLLIMEEIEAILRAVGEKTGDPLSDGELDAIKYIMSKFMFSGISSALISHLSSPSMADTVQTLIDEGKLSTGEFLQALFLMEDMDDPTWQQRWAAVISDPMRSGFVIDCFVQRLLTVARSKALDDNQARRVSVVVSQIEKRLDWTNTKKSGMLEEIRDAVAYEAAREAVL